jgi:DNA-binding GntR family transcriptional regulator
MHLDDYVPGALMRDLAGHDHAPRAFLVYLHLWSRARGGKAVTTVAISHRHLADATGLSKTTVQRALARLKQRRLLRVQQASATAVPVYTVLRPWR